MTNEKLYEKYKRRSQILYALALGMLLGGVLTATTISPGEDYEHWGIFAGALAVVVFFVSIALALYAEGKADGMQEYDAEEVETDGMD